MGILRSLIGAAVGSRIDRRRDGRGGLAGAVAGMAVTRVATRSIPGALAVGGAMFAASMIGKRMRARRSAAHSDQLPPIGRTPPGV